MTQIDPTQLQVVPVNALTVPPEGPVTIPLLLDFTQFSSFQVDLSQFIQLNRVSRIQGIIIDNQDGAVGVVCEIAKLGLRIPSAAGLTTFSLLPTPNPGLLSFYGVGGGDPNAIVRINLTNYALETSQLYAQ